MTPEQLQELEEKAKLWDSLGKSLYDMYGHPTNGTKTIKNTSNAKTHIDLLQEEFGEHLCSCNLKKCEYLTTQDTLEKM